MKRKSGRVLTGLCTLAMAVFWAAPVFGQMSEVKEKPPMYTYVGFWNIPRSQWAEIDKSNAANKSILDKAIASGTLVGYGFDMNLVHQPDGSTHDDWWSAMSMAGVLNVLDQFYKSGTPTSPVLASATKHSDSILVSRYYNWHSGSWKDVYTHGASFKIKPSAPDNSLEMLCKNMFVPLMERLLADGAIHEYEIDTEAIHTETPGSFWLFYLAANAEGLDKVAAAIQGAMKTNPLSGQAFDTLVDFTAHRDILVRTNATYK